MVLPQSTRKRLVASDGWASLEGALSLVLFCFVKFVRELCYSGSFVLC